MIINVDLIYFENFLVEFLIDFNRIKHPYQNRLLPLQQVVILLFFLLFYFQLVIKLKLGLKLRLMIN